MNIDALFLLGLIIFGSAGNIYFIFKGWKYYGLLFLISAISANLLCYLFTYIGFYSFPHIPFHNHFLIPYGLVSTAFPFISLFAVRYSPKTWPWKIPFYWGIIHLGVLMEVVLKNSVIFKFEPEWDLWDSYTIWWLYYLLIELIGGKMIPSHLRKPIHSESFRYGKWAWIILHIIVISTIFLAGVYFGVTVLK
jgi:hypothetical protein